MPRQPRSPVPTHPNPVPLSGPPFGQLMRELREAAGRSRNGLAKEIGVDPSYLTRIESGLREPPRQHIVVAFAKTLQLPILTTNRLLLAAGYAPLGVLTSGGWNPAIQAISDALNDPGLSPARRDELVNALAAVVQAWKLLEVKPRQSSQPSELQQAYQTIATLRREVEELEGQLGELRTAVASPQLRAAVLTERRLGRQQAREGVAV